MDALVDRDIDRQEAERTLAGPEFVVPDDPSREVVMRRYLDRSLGREMLLRIVVEDTQFERVVVTLYKTSRLDKYLKGLLP
ncbi:MAG: hypothetical protein M3R02_05575 [Chloroflexota bacterium]|nr:hypothetical protein [Chloroflexota bacterium]